METATTSHRPLFTDCKMATHMPFFDGKTLVFCQAGPSMERTVVNKGTIWKAMRRDSSLAERFKDLPRSQQIKYRPWKLAFCNWEDKTIRSIATGLPENAIECSPAFYKEGNQVHLSFIGGLPSDTRMVYGLYTAFGPDLDHLGPAKSFSHKPLSYGFVSQHHSCWGSGNTFELTEKSSKKCFRFGAAFARILRVTFVADEPSKILITGCDQKRQYKTIIHDLATGITSEVQVGGPVYKSSLYENRVVFARKIGNGFEDRELCYGGYDLLPSDTQFFKGE